MYIRAAIIEDEPLALQRLSRFIEADGRLQLVGHAMDGAAALQLIDHEAPDLLFLDVELPELSGLEVLQRLEHTPAVIFTTAWTDYAVQAFEAEAVDYLVKPFGARRFSAAVDRIARRFAERQGATPAMRYLDRIFVSRGGDTIPVRVTSVTRFEAAGDYVRAWTREGGLLTAMPLAELAQRLDPALFLRVHRAHIVNLDQIAALAPYDARRLVVRLRDGSEVVASRAGSRELRALQR